MKKRKRKRKGEPQALTVPLKDLRRLSGLVSRALDAGTEFGVEQASRERLLVLHGELVMGLRFVRDQLPDLPPFARYRRCRSHRVHRRQ